MGSKSKMKLMKSYKNIKKEVAQKKQKGKRLRYCK